MERSEMLRPTSCALSHVINLNKETESNEDTEPRHCRNILLCVVPAMLRTEHSCTSFGCASAGVAWASVRLDYSCLNESTGLALAALMD